MNEIERAIGSLEMLRALILFDTMTGEDIPLDTLNRDNRDLYDAAKVALTALREQAERSKGCVFCNDERHRIREAFDEGTAKIINAENRYALSIDTSRDAAIFNIFYCPMCGKRLEVEP